MGTILYQAVVWNADLSGARFIKKRNFKNPIVRGRREKFALSETNELVARESYRGIKHHFYEKGLFEDGSWAAYRELTMERKHFFKTRDPRFIPSFLMKWLSGYTERPDRVIISSFLIILIFAIIYYTFDATMATAPPAGWSRNLRDSIYFSFMTFTTVGYGDFVPKPNFWFRLLTCLEAFSGPFMAGLFVFTLTRRYAAN